MRYFLIALFIFPIITYSQKKPLSFYGDANILLRKSLNVTSTVLGGGAGGGVRFSNFGVGAGAEIYQILDYKNTVVPVFLDLRYFFKKATFSSKENAKFFSAINVGKLIYNEQTKIGDAFNGSETKHEGKSFFSFESGIIISKGSKLSGMLIAIALRRLSYNHAQINYSSRSASGATIPTQTTTFLTKEGITEFALKIGYHF